MLHGDGRSLERDSTGRVGLGKEESRGAKGELRAVLVWLPHGPRAGQCPAVTPWPAPGTSLLPQESRRAMFMAKLGKPFSFFFFHKECWMYFFLSLTIEELKYSNYSRWIKTKSVIL